MKTLLLLFLFFNSVNTYSQLTPSSFLATAPTLVDTNNNNMKEYLTNYHTQIDWTKGLMTTEFCIPITYNDRNIGRNNQNITDKLKERVLQFVLGAIPFVRLSSDFTLNDAFQRDKKIQLSTLSLVYEHPLENIIVTNSKIKGQINIALVGSNSIASLLYNYINPTDVTNHLRKEEVDTKIYDTVIIDTIMFPGFQPALNSRLLDSQGKTLHSINTLNRSALTNQSSVHFVTSITEALQHPATGGSVSYILPKSVAGTLSSDLILFPEDVIDIFGQQRTINNLKKGNVIVIIPERK